MSKILPGSTIGILGSGQLGRMLAVAAGDNNEFEKLTN
jgi:phosphoribosylaminoimidazole carboxylase (NCAIR synthetase)